MKACASANFSWVSRSCDSNSTFWASSSRTRWISSSRVHSVRLMEAVSGDGIGEDLPKVAHQRIEVDVFHRHGKGRIAILARPSLCRSDPLPIGGLVEGTAKTIAFDKRLHQRDPMAILRLPIGRKPPQHTAQNPAAQSLNAHPGQNQKPLVVGEQRKISFAGLDVPADKAIARAPVPLCCQLPREPPPAPVRVRYDQLANLREVGWAQRSTLHQDGLLSLAHEPSMAKEKTGVQ